MLESTEAVTDNHGQKCIRLEGGFVEHLQLGFTNTSKVSGYS